MASPNTIARSELLKKNWVGVAKFYPSNTPVHNPKRDARRRLSKKVSGRQWRKIRKILHREIPETRLTIR